MKEEKVTIRTLIEYGLCVIVWGGVFVQAILKKEYDESLFSFVLHILCVILFSNRFIQKCFAYHKQKKNESLESDEKK
ncbi:hypothetical protein [Oribacterium sp. P6A1]|uniref:hypothetical protein n=1 Tax=Oribacterium sp. P6A1 TaxID=1410612 RepID=UPI0012DEDF53|nr:hypothetical protein [Oribacterium sp. P6A1]